MPLKRLIICTEQMFTCQECNVMGEIKTGTEQCVMSEFVCL